MRRIPWLIFFPCNTRWSFEGGLLKPTIEYVVIVRATWVLRRGRKDPFFHDAILNKTKPSNAMPVNPTTSGITVRGNVSTQETRVNQEYLW